MASMSITYEKEYYQANREKILKYAAEYRKAHKKSASDRKVNIRNNIALYFKENYKENLCR